MVEFELPCSCTAQISKNDFPLILKGNNEISFKYRYFPSLYYYLRSFSYLDSSFFSSKMSLHPYI